MRPPRWSRWLLVRSSPWLGVPELVADADELFDAVAGERGERAARRWYRRQAASALVRLPAAFAARVTRAGRVPPADGLRVVTGQAFRRVRRTPALSVPFVAVVGMGMGAAAFMAQTRGAVMRPELGLGTAVWQVAAYDRAGARRPVTFAWTDAWVGQDVGPAGRLLPLSTRTISVRTLHGRLSSTGQAVPAGLLRAVGVRPLMGRDVQAPLEAVISHGFWRTYLSEDPGVVGTDLALDGGRVTVVGVAPPTFDGLQCCVRMDLWFVPPLSSDAVSGTAIAVGVADASASATAFARVLSRRDASIARVELTPADAAAFGGERGLVGRALALLLGLAVVAWLGTVSGALNLLVADVSERGGEMRLRMALGSGVAAPVTQLLVETAWLAMGAAVIAGATAWTLLALTPRLMPLVSADSVFDLGAGAPAWTAIAAAVLATWLLCGLMAGVLAARLGMRPGIDRGPRRTRAGALVLGVQVALATALVTTSIQLQRDVRALDGGFVGFRHAAAAIFTFSLEDADARGLASADLLDRVASPDGTAALTRWLPVFGAPRDSIDSGAGRFAVTTEGVSSGYFDAIGLHVTAGRPARHEGEIVISEDLARMAGALAAAQIGATWVMGGAPLRVVGVAEPATWGTGRPRPTVYRGWAPSEVRFGYLVEAPVRGRRVDLAEALGSLRDTPYAVGAVGTFADVLTRSRILNVFLARMALVFGVLCFAVALFGVHAQVIRWLSARDRELGIRQALGARTAGIRLLVLRAFAVPVGAGVIAGTATGLAGLRVLRALQEGTGSTPGVSALQGASGVALAALAAALLASFRIRARSPVELMRET